MTKKTVFFLLFALFIFQKAFSQTECPIIPLPNHFENENESFVISNNTPVVVKDSAFLESAYYLKNRLLSYTGITVNSKANNAPAIVFQKSAIASNKKGAYTLNMNDHQIIISASDGDGAFYGVISLLQLVTKAQKTAGSVTLQCWNIKDAPHYQWRGLMLDESRHFFGKKTVKMLLDWMAFYKLNRFHWHLTDAPGWRIQIKKYPKLALIGGIGNHSDSLAPAQYYTQDDIREIVAYAKERHITVIPEIDMPGHATAANRAYPEFSGGGTGKFANFTFNPGNEGTYHYLTNILREVSVLFPSGMVHLGGDEVSFGSKSWNEDSGVKKLMERKHYSGLKAVEHYFLRRMADSALKLNRKIIVWDEGVDAKLPVKNTIVFWWRQNKPQQLSKALKRGYSVVLCPRLPLYFDFVQDKTHQVGRRWNGAFNTLEKVYDFSDTTYPAAASDKDLILGMQADLWTETVQSKRRLEFLLFPRIAALSEAAWSKPGNKNYTQFLSRLKDQFPLYKKAGIYYFNPLAPKETPEVIQ